MGVAFFHATSFYKMEITTQCYPKQGKEGGER